MDGTCNELTKFSDRPRGGARHAPPRGRRLKLAIGAVLCAFAVGCEPVATATAVQEPKASEAVAVVKPELRAIRRSIEQPGTIEAFEQTPLFAKIAGYVKEMRVDI